MGSCIKCGGTGKLVTGQNSCSACKGAGKTKAIDFNKISEKDIASVMANGMPCSECNGKGVVEVAEKCSECGGNGDDGVVNMQPCSICSTPTESEDSICEECRKLPLVYELDSTCDVNEVVEGNVYKGTVGDIVTFGAFVNLCKNLRGLVHESNMKWELHSKDPIFVKVKMIKPNGNLELAPLRVYEHNTIQVEKKIPRTPLSELEKHVGKLVHIAGEVVQVKQTSGPTIFTISDESGLVFCAAFENAGERAYPDVVNGNMIKVIGEVAMRQNELQIEVTDMKKLTGSSATKLKGLIDVAIDKRATPTRIEFLVKSEIMEKLRPAMELAAKEIKKAALKSRPILLRHHADADGVCAAVAIEKAILHTIREVGGEMSEHRMFKRSPSKAPFYELTDITKDITYATEDEARFGSPMPLIVIVDNGSTDEDVPAMLQAQIYGMDIVVIDHHHPDPVVDQYLVAHVNPAHAGGDFGLTAGMLCTEVGRMINPDITDSIRHLAAVAAVGDRSDADEGRQYIELVSGQYSLDDLKDMAMALDYESYWLKFSDGRGIIDDILNIGNPTRHKKMVTLLCAQANEAIALQMEAGMPHVKAQTLPNSALLHLIDVEMFAHRFTFPPPGKMSGEVHDRMCKKNAGKPVVTLGFGPDFAVIRSKGVLMNIPQMVRELRNEIVGGGVNGGGHLVVGSIKFVEGMRTEVLEKLVAKIGAYGVEY